MEVLRSGGDEALTLAAVFLLLAGIVLFSQINQAPDPGAKGSRQTASAIFLMGSLAVFCLIWGRALGRESTCISK
jgi:hypothetical protein